MAIPTTKALARPAHDEWGVYDPEQAGLAALYARLDAKKAPAATPTQSQEVPPLPAPAAKPHDN